MPISSNLRRFSDLEHLGSATGFVDEIYEILQPLALFEDFSKQECAVFCEYMELYGAPSKTSILDEGDDGNYLVIILTGFVRVLKRCGPASGKQVAELGPGGIVGEISLFDAQPRFATCVTNAPTDFAVLTRDSLDNILIDHPRLCNKLLLILLQVMAERLRDTTTRMLPTIVEVPL
ncbi:cyclic nucleotide-binding domain-containing protein [Accumulibacter sp.]|uniref:cyclic nucleotide-binding domain-containing protein n=1 Tax=Accumulibacter sp. TaxID=2053492 RepID=UPI00262B73EB|nr:cyclic nucleotide-binding domain-containing protein [Accumulibacter sp.]